jgi:hypothetical protein
VKTRHLILGAGAAVLVTTIAGVAWLASSLDSLVKSAIERYGPEITGVTVQVGSVNLSPRDGRGSIKGLRLGNPKGYRTARALALGEITIALEPASLAGDVIRIREIVVEGADITYEKVGNLTNLEAIQRNVDAYARKFGGAQPAAGGRQKKMVIDSLVIRSSKVNLSSALTAGNALSVSLPDIHLRDIGKRTNNATAGATAAEVTRQVINALVAAVGRAAASGLRKSASGVGDSVRGLFR